MDSSGPGDTQTPGIAPGIAIIGGGFASLALGYQLKRAGIDGFTIYEKAAELGGVWRENTYPGAACDIPSHLYSFSFEPHYPWSRRYGKQSEILDYQRHVARKYDLQRHFRFGKEVTGAVWDEARSLWQVHFADGEAVAARMLVSAVGQLHRPAYPDIAGQQAFVGKAFHSARWDHSYDFHGKRVAVIGTGASAVQFVPELARQAAQLYVFQRSPGWCIPKFDRAFNAFERLLLRRVPAVHDLDRFRIFWMVEFLASATIRRGPLRALAGGILKLLAQAQLRWQVRDPALRRKLTPQFPIGCKRLLLSNEWLPALAAPVTEVVTEPVAEIVAGGVRTADGRLREVDAIVYGTGFAASEFLAPLELRGRGGRSLREQWKNGADSYLGLGVAGFPNFFMMYGPNTNLGIGTILYMLEAQAQYIAACAVAMQARGLQAMEVRGEVQHAFNVELERRNKEAIFEAGCHSWYIGPDGRNTNNWIGTMSEYGRRLRQPALEDYALAPAPQPA